MGNPELTTVAALDGYEGRFEDTHVREIDSLAIISLSVPRDGLETINRKLNELWQTEFPGTGQCIRIDDTRLASNISALVLYGLQADQCFVVAEPHGNSIQDIVDHLFEALGSVGYLTDQSDSWAVLDIEGALTMPALERICTLDLLAFKTTHVARTAMEHLSVIMEKQSNDCVRLYSPRSSALSFLHAVTTSLKNVEGTSTGKA